MEHSFNGRAFSQRCPSVCTFTSVILLAFSFSISVSIFPSISSAECFSLSGKRGVIRNLDRPWVLNLYLSPAPHASQESPFHLKSFNLDVRGTLHCKNEKGGKEDLHSKSETYTTSEETISPSGSVSRSSTVSSNSSSSSSTSTTVSNHSSSNSNSSSNSSSGNSKPSSSSSSSGSSSNDSGFDEDNFECTLNEGSAIVKATRTSQGGLDLQSSSEWVLEKSWSGSGGSRDSVLSLSEQTLDEEKAHGGSKADKKSSVHNKPAFRSSLHFEKVHPDICYDLFFKKEGVDHKKWLSDQEDDETP